MGLPARWGAGVVLGPGGGEGVRPPPAQARSGGPCAGVWKTEEEEEGHTRYHFFFYCYVPGSHLASAPRSVHFWG